MNLDLVTGQFSLLSKNTVVSLKQHVRCHQLMWKSCFQ